MTSHADANAWVRHATDTRWHALVDIERGSVVTRCRGRWSVGDDYERSSNPPTSERCQACAGGPS